MQYCKEGFPIIPVLTGVGILTGVLEFYAYLIAQAVSAAKRVRNLLGLLMFLAVVMVSVGVMFLDSISESMKPSSGNVIGVNIKLLEW